MIRLDNSWLTLARDALEPAGEIGLARIHGVSTVAPLLHQQVRDSFERHRQILRAGTAALLITGYLVGAIYQGFRINVDPNRTDQSAYMDYARKMAITHFAHVGDRNRMPVYPFLMSFLYSPGMSEEEFFRRGKAFNIALSLLLLTLTFLLLSKWIQPLAAAATVLVAGFTVFMFKAGYFQCELLFYFLNLVLFVLFVENLLRPTAPRAAVLGLVAGLAFLTKSSVLPAISLFLICLAVGEFLRRRTTGQSQAHSALRSFGRAALFLATFFLVTSPYIRTSKRVSGLYFYNVNSTFYLWYDSWEEVERGTKAHGDRVGWPRMPAKDLPSARKYFADHTLSQISARLGNGIVTVSKVAWSSYGYLKYAAIYLLFSLLFIVQHARRTREILFRGRASAATAFVISYFACYLLLYSWYTPIADGNRLTLSLFLPGLAAVGYFLARVAGRLPVRVGDLRLTASGLHRFVVAVLCLDVVFVLPWAITHVSGAD